MWNGDLWPPWAHSEEEDPVAQGQAQQFPQMLGLVDLGGFTQ